jgi:histidinol-phosphate phosphatase family protein
MKAVLLDRDGTLIVEPPHERLQREQDIQFFSDTIEALRLLHDNGFTLIEITNQAGIGEGLITIDKFYDLDEIIKARLSDQGIQIAKTFVCPHKADDDCECRKPKPLLLEQAAQEFNIDLSRTFMIGDNESDVQAGRNAGAKTILVETGVHQVETTQADYRAKNLLTAAQYVIDHQN